MIFNWKSAAYIRKQLPQKERLIKNVSFESPFFSFPPVFYHLTASCLPLYLTCSSRFVILSLSSCSLICVSVLYSNVAIIPRSQDSVFALRKSLSSQRLSIICSSVCGRVILGGVTEERIGACVDTENAKSSL